MNEKRGTQISIPEALIRQAQQGDQSAFTELYERSSPVIYRSIRSMVQDEDLAWDIQQDSYLRAFQSLDTLKEPAAFLPWLRRIAVRAATDVLRKKQPLTFTDLEDDDGNFPVIPETRVDFQPELSLDRQESARLVREILATLSPEQQLVLGMFYYEDLPLKEIADSLQLADGTVKSQLSRGRKKVENAVRALEQQGVKLYGLSPLGFLLALLGQQEPTKAAQTKAMKTILAKTAELGAQSVTLTAKPIASNFFVTAAAWLGAGALGIALISGTAFGIAKLLNPNHSILGDYQSTESMFLSETEHLDDSAENLSSPSVTPSDTPSVTPSDAFNPFAGIDTSEDLPAELLDYLSVNCGEHLTWNFESDTGTLVIEGSGDMLSFELFLPAPWQEFCEQIQEVSLPEGLTSIGSHAFSGCSALKNVTIPDGVTAIDYSAFSGCSSLTSVTIPDSVASIGCYAFSGCSSLKNVTIPDGVTIINNWAFSDCSALTSITIPSSVTYIGVATFSGCSSLTSVTIPDSVTTIGYSAFSGCSSLTSITIPSSVTDIGDETFFGCSSLTSIAIPSSVTDIGDETFFGCSSLTSIAIPSSVTDIGNETFSGCSSLTSVTIPDSVASIGFYAFSGCSSLKNVTIPDSVTEIDSMALGWYIDLESHEYVPEEGFTIHGSEGSAAQRYAEDHDFAFVSLD